jgi:hypothetical protein
MKTHAGPWLLAVTLAACSGNVELTDDGGAGIDAAAPAGDSGVPDAAPVDPGSLAARCAPVITYENTSAANGAIFDDHVPDKQAYFAARSLEVCTVLYRQGSEVPPRPTLKFVVEDTDGVAYTLCGGNDCGEMHLNAGYLKDVKDSGADVNKEIDGVLVHELTHVFQNAAGGPPGWLIEGEADFVRYRAGYIPLSNRHAGGNYDDAYQTTAFFFDYLERTYPDFNWKLNQFLAPATNPTYSDDEFVTLTGKTVAASWSDYQATFP